MSTIAVVACIARIEFKKCRCLNAETHIFGFTFTGWWRSAGVQSGRERGWGWGASPHPERRDANHGLCGHRTGSLGPTGSRVGGTAPTISLGPRVSAIHGSKVKLSSSGSNALDESRALEGHLVSSKSPSSVRDRDEGVAARNGRE